MPCESPPSRPPIRMGTDTSGSDMVVKLYTSWFSGVAGQPPPELRYMWVPIWTPPHPAGLMASLVSDPEGVRGLVARSKTTRPPPRGVTKTNCLLFSTMGQIGDMSGSPAASKGASATTSVGGVVVHLLLAQS